MSVISLKGVSKNYLIQRGKEPTLKGAIMDWLKRRNPFKAFHALEDVSFEVQKGETVGIIGENGSGKSTLLGITAGILKPTSGEIKVQGSVATLLELGAGFHGDLSGRENIYLNGSILGFSKKEMDERYKAIVEFSELEKFINMPVKHFSSGMYVRLGFAIAVEVDPDILLIDEVLAVGDEHFQKKCLRRIEDFQKRGKTILFVSHALELVEEVCSRVILLEQGHIRMEDKPRDVLRLYRKMVQERDERLRPREWGTKEALITSVRFLGSGGKEAKCFFTGQPMITEISYLAPKGIDSPVFGISIHGQDGKNFFGTNTQLENYPIEHIEGEGKIKFAIERLTLFKGVFFFNFSLHSLDHRIQYHRIDFTHQIEVENLREEDGFLKLPCTWELEE
jgi:ABC-2 type transport system ATP-binding protein/lipopolysaccharide transport system ATP-binding protein